MYFEMQNMIILCDLCSDCVFNLCSNYAAVILMCVLQNLILIPRSLFAA